MQAEMVKTTMAIPMTEASWTASAEHAESLDVNGLIPKLQNARSVKPIRVDCHGMIIARHAPLLGVRPLPIIFAQRSSQL